MIDPLLLKVLLLKAFRQIKVCTLEYRKLNLCMFNGDLQRKPTEYHG